MDPQRQATLAQTEGTRDIVSVRAKASCRCGPLSSNVRQHKMSLSLSRTFFAIIWLLPLVAYASPAPASVTAEVGVLLSKLETSGCQFSRGGSWYSGTDARSHLTMKFGHLEKKDFMKSTEDFITVGASTSSMSGKPYLVRCGANPPIESSIWLREQLQVICRPK